jgi:hypothetical protein
MGGSIHIHGTGSSIVDTVFVCRERGHAPKQWLFNGSKELAGIVARDLEELAETGRKPSKGDARCIVFGHLTRMAVWNLRLNWDRSLRTSDKLECFGKAVARLGDPGPILDEVTCGKRRHAPSPGPLFAASETTRRSRDAVAF